MKPAARRALRGAIAFGVVVVVVLVVRAWVIPAVIAGQLRAKLHGPAKFDGWWLGTSSAGVSGLTLREGPGDDSPAWLTAERVETDLSLGGLLRGRFAPTRLDILAPKVVLHFDRKGDLLTKGPFEGDPSSPSSVPDVSIEGGEVTIDQDGRPPMTIRGVSGRLHREEDVEDIELDSDDPTWSHWTVRGRFVADFKQGSARLASGPGFASTPDLTARVPFVPPEVWQNLVPTGPIDVVVAVNRTEGAPKPLYVRTELTFRDASAGLPSLGIVAEGTRGQMIVEDGLVRLVGLKGRSLDGTIAATGTLDFRQPVPRFDLELTLDKIDVARTPASWQLGEVGASGRLTGKARLLIAMNPDGPDLTGSSGEAVIDGAVLQGIPIKSLRLAMKAQGTSLQFETKTGANSAGDSSPVGWAPPTILMPKWWAVPTLQGLVALQEPQKAPAPRFHLPQSITTQIELEDVKLETVLARLEVATRLKPPVPMAGKLSLKADATIPLGHLADLKDYSIRGQATLTGASIAGVDLGRLSAKFALAKGVLDLDDLSGQLVERPNGSVDSPPTATPPRPADAPLVAGGFRGKLRAELSPPGKLTARFEARALPLSELAAPFFPRPTPIGGRLSANFDADGDVAHLDDPRAWTVRGRVESDRVRYREATLDAIATRFAIEGGRLGLPDLSARLGGNPLNARLSLDLAGARAFSGEVDVREWAIERVLALIPRAPRPAPASGVVDGRVAFRGTLRPLVLTSDGRVTIRGATVEAIPLGDVAATWATEGREVIVKEITARPFSGRFAGRATIPDTTNRPARVEATFAEIRTDQLADALTHGRLKLSGTAGGKLVATIPADPKGLAVDFTLEAPMLTVQGVPAGTVAAAIRGKGGTIDYEVTADGPDGKARFHGSVPLGGPSPEKAANAELRASGLGLDDVASLLGVAGLPPDLKGRAAIDANLRARGTDLGAVGLHGFVEVLDLRWGDAFPIGGLRGVVMRSADAWRVDSIRGELAGGVASGVAWGATPKDGPRAVNFEIETDRAALARLLAFAPGVAKSAEGFGTLRIAGRLQETLAADAELSVTNARLGGVAIADLRAPADITYHPAERRGTLRVSRAMGRAAGGRVQGSGWLRFGIDKAFSADLTLADVDVESLMRIGSTAARPGSGKVNGRLTLAGTDPALPRTFRGRIEMGLHDASIGDIPIIRTLDRFLGAAQGGAFESGGLRATIADGRILVDDLRLEGRILQVHATGVVTLVGAVDLVVLVNTNQIIPETGEALAAIIPGLRQAMGRDEEARLRVSNYLSNRLLKFRVGGTIANPNASARPRSRRRRGAPRDSSRGCSSCRSGSSSESPVGSALADQPPNEDGPQERTLRAAPRCGLGLGRVVDDPRPAGEGVLAAVGHDGVAEGLFRLGAGLGFRHRDLARPARVLLDQSAHQ